MWGIGKMDNIVPRIFVFHKRLGFTTCGFHIVAIRPSFTISMEKASATRGSEP